jgi:hypothetical protein
MDNPEKMEYRLRNLDEEKFIADCNMDKDIFVNILFLVPKVRDKTQGNNVTHVEMSNK